MKGDLSDLVAVRDYSDAGWPVFPCRRNGKEPLTNRGFKDASTDPDTVGNWWSRHRRSNWAVATGTPGPDVVDVDIKPDGTGYPAWNQLLAAGLVTGYSRIVRTPSGGMHAYFTGTDQGNGTLPGHHVDFRAHGGYALIEPSEIDGRQYEVLWEAGPTDPVRAVDWQAIRAYLIPTQFPTPPAPGHSQRRRDCGQRLSPIEAFNRDADWPELLTAAGWTPERNGWRRPGKDRGISATVAPDGRLYIYSTSVEMYEARPDGRPSGLSPFDFLVGSRYQGDRRAALHSLGAARL